MHESVSIQTQMTEAHFAVICSPKVAVFLFRIFHCCYVYSLRLCVFTAVMCVHCCYVCSLLLCVFTSTSLFQLHEIVFTLVRGTILLLVLENAAHTFFVKVGAVA